jgi:hypothetical protein
VEPVLIAARRFSKPTDPAACHARRPRSPAADRQAAGATGTPAVGGRAAGRLDEAADEIAARQTARALGRCGGCADNRRDSMLESGQADVGGHGAPSSAPTPG